MNNFSGIYSPVLLDWENHQNFTRLIYVSGEKVILVASSSVWLKLIFETEHDISLNAHLLITSNENETQV